MNEWRTDFLDRLAHDLRGPLSPLQTASYLLKRPDLDAGRQRELVDIVDRQSARLSAMVGELGDWIRAQQNRLVLHREPTPVDMLVELATSPMAVHVRAHFGAALAECTVDGDPQRLVQMLGTLCEFARVRAPETTLDLEAVRRGDRVRITLDSPGEELPPAMIDELFVAQQPAPFDDGLGLRLVIARGIAQAHGGDLTAVGGADGRIALVLDLPVDDPAA